MLEEKKGSRHVVDSGYMGYVDGRYELFADESDYMEVYKEMQG